MNTLLNTDVVRYERSRDHLQNLFVLLNTNLGMSPLLRSLQQLRSIE